MKNVGIATIAFPTWNKNHVEGDYFRNPKLENTKFLNVEGILQPDCLCSKTFAMLMALIYFSESQRHQKFIGAENGERGNGNDTLLLLRVQKRSR